MSSPLSGDVGLYVNEADGPSDDAAAASFPATATAASNTANASAMRLKVSRRETPTIKAALLGTESTNPQAPLARCETSLPSPHAFSGAATSILRIFESGHINCAAHDGPWKPAAGGGPRLSQAAPRDGAFV